MGSPAFSLGVKWVGRLVNFISYLRSSLAIILFGPATDYREAGRQGGQVGEEGLARRHRMDYPP